MSLQRYLLQERGAAPVAIAPGVATVPRFTDPAREHAATRHAAGLFDFSFMACFEIEGRDAVPFLERLQTRRLRGLSPGALAYTLLCRDDASVLNDATVWCRGPGRYALFTGRRSDAAHVAECASGFDVVVRDASPSRAAIAVQGPRAMRVLQAALPGPAWHSLPYFGFRSVEFRGAACDIARLGYSGDAGFEAVLDAEAAPLLWRHLQEVGAPLGLVECGFEAADVLRIEAGFILFSRELAQRVTPFELGLGRLVSSPNPSPMGARALSRLRWRPPQRCLVGLSVDGEPNTAAAARALASACPGHAVATSACRSPHSKRWIALGFVAWEDRYPGTRVRLEGARAATVARLPFFDPAKARPRRGWRT